MANQVYNRSGTVFEVERASGGGHPHKYLIEGWVEDIHGVPFVQMLGRGDHPAPIQTAINSAVDCLILTCLYAPDYLPDPRVDFLSLLNLDTGTYAFVPPNILETAGVFGFLRDVRGGLNDG